MNSTHPVVTIDIVSNECVLSFFSLSEIVQVLDRHTTKEVLRAVLHAILFHRLFGTVKPQTFEVLDVTMPGVADPEIERLINDRVHAFWKAIEGGSSKRGQVCFFLPIFLVIIS